jgi:cytochrome c-type biogenesis protein CcmH
MKRLFLILCLVLAAPAWAVQPDEVLDDPVLESRARDISAGLRCPVCQSESIDESNATLSRDLRLLVRERLVAGDSDQETIDYIVARYGEFVLLRPDARGANLILWLAAPGLLLVGLLMGWSTIRRRSAKPSTDTLEAAEKARLDEILRS